MGDLEERAHQPEQNICQLLIDEFGFLAGLVLGLLPVWPDAGLFMHTHQSAPLSISCWIRGTGWWTERPRSCTAPEENRLVGRASHLRISPSGNILDLHTKGSIFVHSGYSYMEDSYKYIVYLGISVLAPKMAMRDFSAEGPKEIERQRRYIARPMGGEGGSCISTDPIFIGTTDTHLNIHASMDTGALHGLV